MGPNAIPDDMDDDDAFLAEKLAELEAADAAEGDGADDAVDMDPPSSQSGLEFTGESEEKSETSDDDGDAGEQTAEEADSSDSDAGQADADSKESKGTDTDAAAVDDPKPGSAKQEPAPTIPIARFREVTRQQQKDARALREAQDKATAAEARADSYQRQAKVNGIELTEPGSIELTEEKYLEMVDSLGEDAANIIWQQQQQIQKLTGSQAQAETPATEYSDDEVANAIAADADINRWLNQANNGDSKLWEQAVAIDQGLEGEFDTLVERYEEVAKQVKAQIARENQEQLDADSAKTPPENSPAEPKRSLNDVAGPTGQSDELQALMNKPLAAQASYLDQLETQDPAKHARLMAQIDP